jgi:NADH dehydrogenase
MRELAKLLLAHHDRPRPFVHLPVPLCRGLAHVAQRLWEKPTLTLSAIAGIVNDADLDPSLATRDLGYRPLGVTEGFARCFAGADGMQTPLLQKGNVT